MSVIDYSSEQSLGDIYLRKNNSFDFLRFLLATVVIYSHSYILLLGSEKSADFIVTLTKNQISAATISVYGFFVISGFLITQSLENSNSYLNYLIKRILRIIPAFLTSIFIIGFVIGPLLTNLDFRGYFSFNGIDSPYSFLIRNITFNTFGYSWGIRDMFYYNPFPGSVNGSMWSLKHEFALYLILGLLSYFLIIKYKQLLLTFTVLIIILSELNLKNGYVPFKFTGENYWVLGGNEYSSFITLAPYFLVGSIIYLYKNSIVFSYRIISFMMLLLLFTCYLLKLKYFLVLLLPYLIISVAVKFKFKSFSKYGDFSYGMYIYAFPIQQILVFLWKDSLKVGTFFLLSSILTLFISIISWKYIEKPVLDLKYIINNKKKSVSNSNILGAQNENI